MIRTPHDVRQLGAVLAIWAHPDDETFTAAGVLAAAAHNGQQVVCITATRGEKGVQDETKWPLAQLADIRTHELQEALSILGIEEHYWLSYADGKCQDINQDEAVQAICQLVEEYKFDSLLTFGPEGLTGHPDHCAVSRWSHQVAKHLEIPQVHQVVITAEQYEHYFKQADQELNIFFNIAQPPLVEPDECSVYLELPASLCQLKLAALAAMPSQTHVFDATFETAFLHNMFAVEAFKISRT